jgi:hypothetical protein
VGEERVALRLTDRDAELRQAAEELEAMDKGFTRTRAAMERVRDGQRALSQRASDALERNFEELCARLRGELLCVLVPATEERVLVQFDLDLDAKGALPAAMILKFAPHAMLAFRAPKSIAAPLSPWRWHASEGDVEGADAVSVLLFTVTFHANHAHNLTRSP